MDETNEEWNERRAFFIPGEGKGLNEWRNERIESESHLGGNVGKIKERKGRFEGKCVCEWNK